MRLMGTAPPTMYYRQKLTFLGKTIQLAQNQNTIWQQQRAETSMLSTSATELCVLKRVCWDLRELRFYHRWDGNVFISFHTPVQEALSAGSQTPVHLVLIWSLASFKPSLITGWEVDQHTKMLLNIRLNRIMCFSYFPLNLSLNPETGCSCGGKFTFLHTKSHKKPYKSNKYLCFRWGHKHRHFPVLLKNVWVHS